MTRVVPHTTAPHQTCGRTCWQLRAGRPGVETHRAAPNQAREGGISHMAGLSNDNLSHGAKRAGHHDAR